MVGNTDLGGVRGRHCMIDSGDSICIYPKGEISVCEHYLEDHFISHVDNPNDKNWEQLKKWRSYLEENELCKDCPIKPSCLRAKECTDGEFCFPKKKEYHINRHKRGMLGTYRAQMNQGDNCCSCGNCDNTNYDCPEHKANCDQHYPTQPGDWKRIMSDGTVIPIKSYQQ